MRAPKPGRACWQRTKRRKKLYNNLIRIRERDGICPAWTRSVFDYFKRAQAGVWLRRTRNLALLGAVAPLLGGCHYALLDPAGPIGRDELNIIYLATGLMLLVVVPVIILTLVFAWRYRASNVAADYRPDWAHSNRIEAVVWLVPCIIVAILGYVTWTSSHTLDPYRPIASARKPIEVDVASLNWKWLFIYPQLGIASVNELAFPVHTPVNFRLTSSRVMNAFFIPRLGSQIYTMAGMQTKLSLMADRVGTYQGISSNFSGDGFSKMRFAARAMSAKDFKAWIRKVRASHQSLTLAAYRKLERPSENVPVQHYAWVAPRLFHDILNLCTDGQACIDAQHLARRMSASGHRMAMAKRPSLSEHGS
ncbi:MAG: ubiquinol oxidase subunit II [Alphaproteobacteria bacterium]|nr:ubiquinol oxidase subunit II [Alphaproteobacteria bacterium]